MTDEERPRDNAATARAEFVERFGGIYEHSRWVAEQAWDERDARADDADLAWVLADCVNRADTETKLALIRAHPDLAGKAAVQGELTPDSSVEQRSAGIDQCTPDEFRSFQVLNDLYKQKFGFPFVMAVRDSNRHEILAAFEERLQNDAHTEFERAIAEIHRIARLRLDPLQRQQQDTGL